MTVTKIQSININNSCSVDNYTAGSIAEMEDYFRKSPPDKVHPCFGIGGAYVMIPRCRVSIVNPSEYSSYKNHIFRSRKDFEKKAKKLVWLEMKDYSAKRVMPYLPEDFEQYKIVMTALRKEEVAHFGDTRLFYLVPKIEPQGNLAVVSLREKITPPDKTEKTLVQIILDIIPKLELLVKSPIPIPLLG